MRKRRLTIGLLTMMMAVGVAFGGDHTDVNAASKLSVNRVYENATKVTGKTKKKNTVKIKIGGKTYKAKANTKGKFTVKIPKVAAGKKYTLKSYKGKKVYSKKTVYVIAKKLKVNKYSPSDRSISGYTRPKYKVEVTIGNKTIKKTASAVSGYWKVTLGKGKKVGTTVSVKVKDTKGKTVTKDTKHVHDYKPVYKTIHHEAKGHYETVTVPAYDEEKTVRHQVCYAAGCGRDKTQDFIDSIRNKTYPEFDQATKDNWGYTKENGWPHSSSDLGIYKEMGVNPEDMKEVPPFGMYLGLGGWDEKCDGHRYGSETVKVTVHHEATTKQEWKVDQKAYDEKVVIGYKCDCGDDKSE